MLSLINDYFSNKEHSVELITKMSILMKEFKNSNEYVLIKSIINAKIKETLEFGSIEPNESHAILNRMAGLNSILLEVDDIIEEGITLKKKLEDEEEYNKEDEEITNFIDDNDSSSNALIL